jgi:hypothetical protein
LRVALDATHAPDPDDIAAAWASLAALDAVVQERDALRGRVAKLEALAAALAALPPAPTEPPK